MFQIKQKALDAKSKLCETGLTDSSNTAAPAAPQEQQKVLDRQKQVCETGLTERNATTGSKIKQKCLTAEAKRVKLAALNEQTNPGTAQRASLKEHYHDCNHQKRPG